ncbi:MAG: glycosyltransferase family 52, partial [Paraglaciecola sp.]
AALPADTECLFCERNDHDIVSAIKQYAKHLPWLKKQTYDYVFFADSRLYIFVDIVNALQHSNTFLMDDGAGIIQTVHTLKTQRKYFDIPLSTNPERRKLIERTKKEYGLWQPKHVQYNLFSAFDFDSCEEFRMVENPMSGLRYDHPKIDHSEVLIVGQPFVINGHMKSDVYIHCIRQIQRMYPDKKINYFPHPRETEADLVQLRELFGLFIVETNLPIEEYIMQLPASPSEIAGFYSAALWYISKFQPDITVKAFRLSADFFCFPKGQMMWGSSHLTKLEVTELVYDYFKLRINVVDLLMPVSPSYLE